MPAGQAQAVSLPPVVTLLLPCSTGNRAWWDFQERELVRWVLNSGAVHQPELLPGREQDSLHIPLLFVWPLVHIHCAVVHSNLLCYDILCWKTRSGNAIVDPGAFLQPLSEGISWTAPTCRDMGQLQLPQNVLQRSRLQGYLETNIFCFPKYN